MWNAGYNMPGYLPETEPAEFENWADAREYILETLARHADEMWGAVDGAADDFTHESILTAAGELDETYLDLSGKTATEFEWVGYADNLVYWIELATGE